MAREKKIDKAAKATLMWLQCDELWQQERPALELDSVTAMTLQLVCEGINPELPGDLESRLHLLFAGVAQLGCMTTSWATAATKSGKDPDVVSMTANKALNAVSRAATCVALEFAEQASEGRNVPSFSSN